MKWNETLWWPSCQSQTDDDAGGNADADADAVTDADAVAIWECHAVPLCVAFNGIHRILNTMYECTYVCTYVCKHHEVHNVTRI